MIADTAGHGPGVVTVDAGTLQELTEKYTEYRETLYGGRAFDPVHTMHLTGEVLASVREIIATGQVPHPAVPAGEGTPGQ